MGIRKIVTVLEPSDEYTLVPDESSNCDESMYLNGFDLEREVGGWFRLGNRVNVGNAEMTVHLYLPGGRIGFMYRRPPITTDDDTRAGGLHVEVIEPVEQLRVGPRLTGVVRSEGSGHVVHERGTTMAELELLDRGYATVMRRVVDTGQAQHYTELAAELGIDLADARRLVHELVAITPGWTHPGTDHLASFPPFNIQPTQYRVTIDGEQRWFAQCGFEAMAIRWLVPGKDVRVDAPCLCCGEPIRIEMCDEELTSVDPTETVGYTSSEVGGEASSRPFR